MAVVDAVKELLERGQPPRPMTVNDYGCWRHPLWRDQESRLQPFLSVDWYVANAWDVERQQVNANVLMETLALEPWRRAEAIGDHYDVLVVDQDLYSQQRPTDEDFIVGIARPAVGTVVSTHRLESLSDPFFVLKTIVIHELCHVFGTPDPSRTDVDRSHGAHCTNRCVMRFPAHSPRDWEHFTEDRFLVGPLCLNCTEDLRRYFHAGRPRENE
jgi:predicted Zn-dependent protease